MVSTRSQKQISVQNKIERVNNKYTQRSHNYLIGIPLEIENTMSRSSSPLSVTDPCNQEYTYTQIKTEDGDDNSSVSSDGCLRTAKEHIQTIIPTVKPYITSAYKVSALYLFWVTLHYVTAQLYVKYCAHPSIYGFIISPFLISAPHCMAMRWVFNKGGTLIEGMWILLGTWLCSKIIT